MHNTHIINKYLHCVNSIKYCVSLYLPLEDIRDLQMLNENKLVKFCRISKLYLKVPYCVHKISCYPLLYSLI